MCCSVCCNGVWSLMVPCVLQCALQCVLQCVLQLLVVSCLSLKNERAEVFLVSSPRIVLHLSLKIVLYI